MTDAAYIQELVDRLTTARIAYYGPGEPTLSDAAYDALEDELHRTAPNHPLLKQVGSPSTGGWPKVRHPIPTCRIQDPSMGSLNKAQTAPDLHKWYTTCFPSTRTSAALITEKLDGISILLHYDKGLLTGAVTRGDGVIGEDITPNVAKMKGLPSAPLTDANGEVFSGHVRGEIVCYKDTWATHFPGDSNPRNTASGVAKRQHDNAACEHLTVVAFNVFSANHDLTRQEYQLFLLDAMGFTTPFYTTVSGYAPIRKVYDEYVSHRREAAPYEIDGLVISVNESAHWNKLGTSSDRPVGSIAYKFPHDASSTVLTGIRWQVGSTGRVTPVAEFDPVDLAGASVRQASLHTLANINELTGGRHRLRVGSVIQVSRRNDVIPYVEALLQLGDGPALVQPPHCPVCGTPLGRSGEYLICPNTVDCPAQTLGGIRNWIKKTGTLHFGDAMLKAVIEAGMVSTIADLYRLDASKMAMVEMDGRRIGGAAKRALDSLHSRKTLPLDVFVGSLGIPLCGRRMVRTLMEGGLTDMNALASATPYQLEKVPGFGGTKALEFREGFDARKSLIVELYGLGVTAAPYTPPSSTGPLSGVSVCFTGIRDKKLEAEITQAGGVIKSGVSGALSLLVAKDPSATSGKTKKARDLGIEIISVDEMRGRVSTP